ncbi:peptidase domain-containing protein (plasmid) [Leptolyngbya boryana NIES-2135]|uniref:Peptidase domain-containing protein n=1 Tax=Leptolyngbya boryana NIES-2135 TaxID=1973484 RepID=A0A1Z4JT23_LEPBY|nr:MULTISPECIES: hypothetical protein [Leptolyngbya]BAY59872.1 peptidase domain-containing protein [Leptolyngbya boryana NIES-2135]MBD2369576.1 hypothetical protein [Leptolyngbya sp. FACHB-161]MBD2375979.1 hypothetical protein [Leptolyngbya sp. FACHB-238]MBD2400255.1 hypothetical protein [Leptolyngbya sp. FACHB-239]MBD2406797.1 hypothetical protein [Leptolyngbya sp. FACHB-402]
MSECLQFRYIQLFLVVLACFGVINRATIRAEARPDSRARNQAISYPNPAVRSRPTVQPIQYGSVIPGVLAPGGFQFRGRFFDAYRFRGLQGDYIRVSVVGSTDSRSRNSLKLKPAFVLLDMNNNVIGEGKQYIEAINLRLQTKLSATGIYTIVVTSSQPGDIGRYSLALQRTYKTIYQAEPHQSRQNKFW